MKVLFVKGKGKQKTNPILDNLKVPFYYFLMSENRGRMYRIRMYKKSVHPTPCFLEI